MSDDFDHAADAMDRLCMDDGHGARWVCPRCGLVNEALYLRCIECRHPMPGIEDFDR